MNKAILITGASTGIGHAAATSLAGCGFHVFAGVRSERDFDKARAGSTNITPVILDVTKSEQVRATFAVISSQAFAEFHLINNAGIAVVGPVETLPVSEFKRQFDVNFFGLIETTQVFLPLLRKTRGRIINISSVAGLSSSPFLSAYASSKYALEALSDSLRWELSSSGVKVVIIEPGPIATPIWDKGFVKEADLIAAIPAERFGYYEKAIHRFVKAVRGEANGAIPVSQVVDAITKGLLLKNPPNRIVVAARAAKLQSLISQNLPSKVMDHLIQKGLFRE